MKLFNDLFSGKPPQDDAVQKKAIENAVAESARHLNEQHNILIASLESRLRAEYEAKFKDEYARGRNDILREQQQQQLAEQEASNRVGVHEEMSQRIEAGNSEKFPRRMYWIQSFKKHIADWDNLTIPELIEFREDIKRRLKLQIENLEKVGAKDLEDDGRLVYENAKTGFQSEIGYENCALEVICNIPYERVSDKEEELNRFIRGFVGNPRIIGKEFLGKKVRDLAP